MADLGRFPVHKPACANNGRPVRVGNTLVPQTNAEDRYLSRKSPYNVVGNARFLRRTRAWRYDDVIGLYFLDFGEAYLVVSKDFQPGAKSAYLLYKIIGERIVIIDDDYHGGYVS